jgi:glycosyltransferase involved in cell wall biosynthesis
VSTASALVSVVVPSYEHGAHIEEALRSVALQRDVDLELVVVDDASRDDSVAVVERLFDDPAFASRFEHRLRLVVHETNQGAHAAINRGLCESTGDFLTILNSDDAYAPDRLSDLLRLQRASGAQLAMSRVVCMDTGADRNNGVRESFRLRRHQDGVERHPSIGFACMASNVAISSGNLFFSRALFEAVGGFDDLRYCHDWGFLLRAVLTTEPILVQRPLYRYRLHDTNSYRTLNGVAEVETERVLRRFFEAMRLEAPANRLAPSPEHWPGVFEYWMDRLGFWRYW